MSEGERQRLFFPPALPFISCFPRFEIVILLIESFLRFFMREIVIKVIWRKIELHKRSAHAAATHMRATVGAGISTKYGTDIRITAFGTGVTLSMGSCSPFI